MDYETITRNIKMGALTAIYLLVIFMLNFSATEGVRYNGSSTNAFGEAHPDNCRRKTSKPCQEKQFSTCFGVNLPYGFTSNELVNENFTQQQIQVRLSMY